MFDKMNQKQADDRDIINQVKEELDNGKVDRSTLSSLLTELAMQVSGNDFSADLLKNNPAFFTQIKCQYHWSIRKQNFLNVFISIMKRMKVLKLCFHALHG